MRYLAKNVSALFFLLIIFLPLLSSATHVMGSEIRWQSIGKDSFLVTVHGYRDCNGIPLSGTDLTYYSSSPGTCVGSTTPSAKVCCGTDITPVCSSTTDRCASSSSTFTFGIQQWTITATVYLPGPCCNYTIAWQECCRSGAITTGAAGYNYYAESYLDRCKAPKDNSPYFTLPPTTIFCENQCIYYNLGATDDDRDATGQADSLVYSFGQPSQGPGSPIGYTSPYTDTTPVIYSGSDPNAAFVMPYCLGFHLDPNTGEIEFKSTKQDVSVLVIVVDEYRKDSTGTPQWIGETRRDVQIAVISCPTNHPPVLTGVNSGTSLSINMCAGHQSCFTIKAFDLDIGDSDVISWNNPASLSGATFASDKKSWPTGTFCWTPKIANVRSYPYTFLATATDQSCPVPGRASRAYTIYVYAEPPTATYSATVTKCGQVFFSAKASATSPDSITNYVWTGDSTPYGKRLYINGKLGTYQYHTQGVYHYSLAVSHGLGCPTIYNDSVTIAQVPFLKLPDDTLMCTGPTLNLTARYAAFSKKDTIKWSTGATGTSLKATITKDTVFEVYVRDTDGCATSDTMRIKTNQSPIAYTGPSQSVCTGQQVTLGGAAVAGVTYSWATRTSGLFVNTSALNVTATGTATIYILSAKSNINGCASIDTVTVTGYPVPTAYAGSASTVCADTKVSLGTTSTTGYTYTWSSVPAGFKSTVSNPVARPLVNTRYKVTTTSGGTCTRSDSVMIAVNPQPAAFTHADTTICSGTSIRLGKAPVSGVTYLWTSKPAGFSANTADTTVMPKSSISYILTATGTNHCSNTDTTDITVYATPDPSWSMLYLNDRAVFYAHDSSFSASGYEWLFGDGDSATGYHAIHLYPSNKTYHAGLRIISTTGCRNEKDSSLAVAKSGIAEDNSPGPGLIAYPNPFSTVVTLKYYLSASTIIHLDLMDMAGKQFSIITGETEAQGLHQLDIIADRYTLHPGMYLLKLETGDGYYTKELVKF